MYAHLSGYMRTALTARGRLERNYTVKTKQHKTLAVQTMILCIYTLTYNGARVIGLFMTSPAKKKALLASGTLNPDPQDVQSDLFKLDFFDPSDRAQVKYEMLRAHSVDGDSVAEACRQFGFSRESFYQIQQAFSELGFISFLPGKRGRKGPVKLKRRIPIWTRLNWLL